LGLGDAALKTVELSGGLRALRLGLRKAGGTLAHTGLGGIEIGDDVGYGR